jgi:voltage-gated potassium channel
MEQESRRRSPRRLLSRWWIPEHLVRKTRSHILVIVTTLAVATVLFAYFEDYPLFDSLLFIVLIMTLIGANYSPATIGGKAVTIVVAFMSVGVILSFLTQVLGPVALSNFWETLRTRRVSHVNNHVILCGYSDTARVLIRQLPKKEVLVIVKDRETEEALASHGVAVLRGNYESEEVLRQAGVSESRAVVAASEVDSENAFVCLSAKRLAPRVPVVVTVSSQENEAKLKDVRADHIISPALLSASAILDIVGSHPDTS